MKAEVRAGSSEDLVAPSDPVRTASEELIIKEARQRHRRRLLAITGIAVVVAGGGVVSAIALARHGSPTRTSSTVATSPGKPKPVGSGHCQNGQVSVISLSGDSGAGNALEVFGFVNSSKASCTLTGYPRVVALNASGQVASTAKQALSWNAGGVQNGSTTPPMVSLAPGQTASATVQGLNIPTGAATSCPPVYRQFLVTPPATSQSVRLTAGAGPNLGEFPARSGLVVTPIVPGTSGIVQSLYEPPQGSPQPPGPSSPSTTTTSAP